MHSASTQFPHAHRMSRLAALLPPSLLWLGCGESAAPGTVALWAAPTLSGSAPVADARPNIIFCEAQGAAHQALATRFTAGEQIALTPEQLDRLRALGYIR